MVFGHSRSSKGQRGWLEESEGGSGSSQQPRVRHLHYMYIQMEFCDKQTLRGCIDNDLCKDQVCG